MTVHRSVRAAVLFPHGWEPMEHRSQRCSKKVCTQFRKLVWHNYVSDTNGVHRFCWPANTNMQFFFLSASWGVSTSWLRQFSRRLVQRGCGLSRFIALMSPAASSTFFIGDLDLVVP